RRAFLADVGRGVVAASIGAGLAADLGFSTAFAEAGSERLNFGTLEPLVGLMQETAPARLIPTVVGRLRQGTPLRDVVAAPAEGLFATIAGAGAAEAFNAALMSLADGADVHRVVLPYRAWDLMGIIGRDHAHTLLRQSIRFNVRQESPQYVGYVSGLRTLLP